MKERLRFLKTALLNFNVGAIARSSKYVVRGVMSLIPGREILEIVEYGPGDGVLTRELLKRLSPKGRLLAVENDPAFIKALKEIHDSRLQIVKGAMQNTSKILDSYGFTNVDVVVSSVPFSYLTGSERRGVTHQTKKSLAPNGMFIVFHQYTPLMLGVIKKYFNNARLKFEPRNVLPCFMISAVKRVG